MRNRKMKSKKDAERPRKRPLTEEELKRIEALEDEEDLRLALKALKEVEKYGTIPWEVVKKKCGLK